MNTDIHLSILDQMDLEELLKMANINRYFEHLSVNTFQRQCSMKTIQISNSFGKSEKIMYFHDGIALTDLKFAAKVLKTFGHKIRNLIISYTTNIDKIQTQKINKYINTFCAESLIELHFKGFVGDPLIEMSNFPTVEVVSFIGDYAQIGSKTVKLNEIFPTIHTLHLSIGKIEHQNCIDLEFPRLEHFSTVLTMPDIQFISFNESTVEQFLKKNRKIRSVCLDFVSLSFLEKLNDILPNLDALSIDLIADEDLFHKIIRFKNVKKLTIKTVNDIVPLGLAFDQLEEVEFECSGLINER